MLSKILKIQIVLFSLVCLSACVSKPDVSGLASVNKLENITQQWMIKGKLAIITSDERKSAYLAWQQDNEDFEMTLNTLVGSTIANLDYNGDLATLRVDGDTYTDTSPDRLLERTTGWQIPAASLPIWITGKAKEGDAITFYENGLLKTLQPNCQSCGEWNINYEKYGSFDFAEYKALALPSRVVLENATVKLIIRIDDWQAI